MTMEPKTEPTVQERTQACSVELIELLSRHGMSLVAAPTFKPDGRGGWFVDCEIKLIPRDA